MRTRSTIVYVASLAAFFAYGCQDSPRNGQVLTTPVVTFSGFSQYASAPVQIQARDRTVANRWDTFATSATDPASAPTTDAVGKNWYSFVRDVTLPMASKYWTTGTTVSGQRRIKADVRSSTPNEGALYTFDVNDSQCLEDTYWEGGVQMLLTCNPEATRVSTVSLNCGKSGQACCAVSGINASRFCDTGLICGASNTCIATGGLNQPCSINEALACDASTTFGNPLDCVAGPSTSPHSPGTCRDVTIERAPIITLELAVRNCDHANASTTSAKYVSLQLGHNYYLDRASADTVRNTTDYYGIASSKFRTLGDIQNLSLSLHTSGLATPDDWCFNRVELIANGRTVLRRDYPNGQWIGGTGSTGAVIIPGSEIRRALLDNDRDAMCALPSRLTFNQMKHMVEGALGDTFQRSTLELVAEGDDPIANLRFDAWWSTGYVTYTRLNSTDLLISTKFRVKNENVRDASSNPIFDAPTFEVPVEVDLIAHFSCNWDAETTGICQPNGTCTQRIDHCETDYYNFLEIRDIRASDNTPIISDFVEWVVESTLREKINDQLDNIVSISDMFHDTESLVCEELNSAQLPMCFENAICGCPTTNVGTSSVTMDWSSFGVPGFNLNSLPWPMCQ